MCDLDLLAQFKPTVNHWTCSVCLDNLNTQAHTKCKSCTTPKEQSSSVEQCSPPKLDVLDAKQAQLEQLLQWACNNLQKHTYVSDDYSAATTEIDKLEFELTEINKRKRGEPDMPEECSSLTGQFPRASAEVMRKRQLLSYRKKVTTLLNKNFEVG